MGAEYELLIQSGSVSVTRFILATVFILVITGLTIASVWYAMELLFHLIYVEWLMAVFISGLFMLIYVFLINTFSKQAKTHYTPAIARWKTQLTASNIIRTAFIVLIGFLIAQPAGVWAFRSDLKDAVYHYKTELSNAHRRKVNTLYDEQIALIDKKTTYYKDMIQLFSSKSIEAQIKSLSESKIMLIKKKDVELQLTVANIQQADFFLYRVRLVSGKPLSWLIWIGIIVLFLLPGYLVYSIGSDDKYFQLRDERDRALILEQYHFFEKAYSAIFRRQFNKDVLYYSRYKDPPLCSQFKDQMEVLEEKLFIEKFGSDNTIA